MSKSQFNAGTFGVGELITQRKLFRVPPHQRSYAWNKDSVNSYLADIESAFNANASEYFIGLIVIQGTQDGEWILLDGQQRLTTSTMIFAAIRNWLKANEMEDDSRQIESEFLGVRRLGGDYSSRMQLNEDNQEVFKSLVVESNSIEKLKEAAKNYAKKSSNYFIIDAAIECQNLVDSIAANVDGDKRGKAERLFRLASFIESRVKVVCVEVSSDVDAYILFESLNDRGVELSALDLLKNYAYSKSVPSIEKQLDVIWEKLITQLDDRNPDDFLKVSWTAKHGLVQKTQLFKNIRNKYQTSDAVLELLSLLSQDAKTLSALDDAEHIFWNEYPPKIRDYVYILGLLGSRQVRPVILAGISNLSPQTLERLMWYLIVVVVRYQIIGRGRTGVMEKIFSRLCVAISSGIAVDASELKDALSALWVDNGSFAAAFSQHSESRLIRFAYMLSEIELRRILENKSMSLKIQNIREILADSRLIYLPAYSISTVEGEDECIGSFALIENELITPTQTDDLAKILQTSKFELTRSTVNYISNSNELDSYRRNLDVSELAISVWNFDA